MALIFNITLILRKTVTNGAYTQWRLICLGGYDIARVGQWHHNHMSCDQYIFSLISSQRDIFTLGRVGLLELASKNTKIRRSQKILIYRRNNVNRKISKEIFRRRPKNSGASILVGLLFKTFLHINKFIYILIIYIKKRIWICVYHVH